MVYPGQEKLQQANFEKKIRNSLLVDGDKVRKYISKDLSYKLKDRKIQIDRVLGITKL